MSQYKVKDKINSIHICEMIKNTRSENDVLEKIEEEVLFEWRNDAYSKMIAIPMEDNI